MEHRGEVSPKCTQSNRLCCRAHVRGLRLQKSPHHAYLCTFHAQVMGPFSIGFLRVCFVFLAPLTSRRRPFDGCGSDQASPKSSLPRGEKRSARRRGVGRRRSLARPGACRSRMPPNWPCRVLLRETADGPNCHPRPSRLRVSSIPWNVTPLHILRHQSRVVKAARGPTASVH